MFLLDSQYLDKAYSLKVYFNGVGKCFFFIKMCSLLLAAHITRMASQWTSKLTKIAKAVAENLPKVGEAGAAALVGIPIKRSASVSFKDFIKRISFCESQEEIEVKYYAAVFYGVVIFFFFVTLLSFMWVTMVPCHSGAKGFIVFVLS